MTTVTSSSSTTARDDAVVIRVAVAADAPALERLALLDSAPRPLTGMILVGEQDGEIRAARSLADDRTVADPFRATAGLTALLATRAQLLRGARPARTRGPALVRRRAATLVTLR